MGRPFLDALRSPNQTSANFLAEQAQRAGLPESVISGLLRGARGIPNTIPRLSHGFRLLSAKGLVIGGVYGFSADQTRGGHHEYEIDPNARGEPSEYVPEKLEAPSASIDFIDLNTRIVEEIFGTRELVVLTDQAQGFRIRTSWRAPASFLNSKGRVYEYSPCWFKSLGRHLSADGDRVVRVNAELAWTRRRKVG